MSNPSDHSQKKRKRQRPIISCTECHRRKQKCDRQQPCGNCTLRSASHLCHYESQPRRSSNSGGDVSLTGAAGGGAIILATGDVTNSFGYIRNRGFTASEVLEKLDLEDGTWGKDASLDIPEQIELHSYNKIIGIIPPRPYCTLLVRVFFAETNWIYGALHDGSFYQLLDEWYESCSSSSPPCPAHSKSTQSPRRKVLSQFPALLLQVLALALQMLPKEHYKQMAQLNLGKEDFRNLSTQYSSSACELASLLAANTATLPRIQCWFLRGSWLKNEGRAVEAWHALGQAIREAQELGLHKEPPRKYSGSGEDMVSVWNREFEKRVWINLYVWDRFMSMILGRPMLINDRYCTAIPPIDCVIPADLKTPPKQRGPMDPPTPFTQRLLDYQLAHIANEIDELQLKSSKHMSVDFTALDRLHSKLRSFTECFPRPLAINQRDTSYDSTNPFLPAQTELLKSSAFSLAVGLHRAFVFTRDRSRAEIVKAGLAVLESQARLFVVTQEHHHTIYTLNFFTFDPAVLIAAVLITAPLSIEVELRDRCMHYLREGSKRMEVLGKRVKLAEKGAAVLRLLVQKAEGTLAQMGNAGLPGPQTSISSGTPSDTSSPFTSSVHTIESPASSTVGDDLFNNTALMRQSSNPPFPIMPSLLPSQTSSVSSLNSQSQDHYSPGEQNIELGYGPISTQVLSTRDLDEILALPDLDSSGGGESGADFGPFSGPAHHMFADPSEGETAFWQNLLNVPWQ